jgi:hypothetical protein
MQNVRLNYYLSIILIIISFNNSYCQKLKKKIFKEKGKETVLFKVPWDVSVDKYSKTLYCELIQTDSVEFPGRTYKFFNEKFDSVIYSFEADDYPLAIYPLKDNSGNLIIVSSSGTSIVFSVFSYSDGKIYNVLHSGSKFGPPELIYEDKGNYSIIVTHMDSFPLKQNNFSYISAPYTASIYRWKKDRYIEIPNVPWSKRLNWKK